MNNAATTPPFEKTIQEVNEFLLTYSAFTRGAGPHATATYNKVMEAVSIIRKFINAGEDDGLLFTANTTSAINLFARIMRLDRHDAVMTSPVEHTSNSLPWRLNSAAELIEAETNEDGSLDYDSFEMKAERYGRRLKVIAMNGASNTTGYVPDFLKLSRVAKKHGAIFFIDAAQLAPCAPIDMKRDGIDALAFSAHKVYSPFGIGVLALPKKLLWENPIDPGGGTVDMVSDTDIVWTPSMEQRNQSGTWNVTGIVALAASCKTIMDTGWDAITAHQRSLTEYAAKRLSEVSGLKLYVSPEKYMQEKRLGIFSFNLEGYHHALLSSILEHEYGIETRSGTICNHRLIRRWFNITDEEQRNIEREMAKGDRLATFGIVRASLGIHNTAEDIDALVEALSKISRSGPELHYREAPEEGIFLPVRK